MGSFAESPQSDYPSSGETKRSKVVLSLEETIASCELLGEKIRQLVPMPDLAIGIANGGILPTLVAGNIAGIDFEVRKVRRKGSRMKMRLSILRNVLKAFPQLSSHPFFKKAKRGFDRKFDQIETSGWIEGELTLHGKHIVVIDDCVDSGSTVAFVRDRLMREGAASVRVAVLSWGTKNDSKEKFGIAPDIFLTRTIDVYPWALDSPAHNAYLEWLSSKDVTLWR